MKCALRDCAIWRAIQSGNGNAPSRCGIAPALAHRCPALVCRAKDRQLSVSAGAIAHALCLARFWALHLISPALPCALRTPAKAQFASSSFSYTKMRTPYGQRYLADRLFRFYPPLPYAYADSAYRAMFCGVRLLRAASAASKHFRYHRARRSQKEPPYAQRSRAGAASRQRLGFLKR